MRSFSDRPVTDDDLRRIIEAGCAAPSSKNDQPWRVVVVRNPNLRNVCEAMGRGIQEGLEPEAERAARITYSIMPRASVGVFVFLDDACASNRVIAHLQSIGAFMENMLLMAESLGIGGLWCGDILYSTESLKDSLHVDLEPVAAAVFGYEDVPGIRKNHKSPEDVIIKGYDEWKYR